MPERYGRVVTPVYAPGENGLLECVGSGVLIQSGDGYWLFSAAHVLSQKKYRELWLPGVPRFFRLMGKINRSKDEQIIDLAYCRLSQQEAELLIAQGNSFLPAKPSTLDHSGVPAGEGACLVVGFPWSRVEPVGGNPRAFSVQALEYRGHLASTDRIRRYGRDPNTTLMVQFDARVIIEGKKTKRPKRDEIEGISGGAIWGIYSDNVRLLGIVHELIESRSVLLGTRCRVFPMIERGEA